MTTFIVSYDKTRDANYDPLWSQLEAWGGTRLTESLWVLNLQATAAEVLDFLRATVLDGNDLVTVFALPFGVDWSAFAKTPGIAHLVNNIGGTFA